MTHPSPTLQTFEKKEKRSHIYSNTCCVTFTKFKLNSCCPKRKFYFYLWLLFWWHVSFIFRIYHLCNLFAECSRAMHNVQIQIQKSLLRTWRQDKITNVLKHTSTRNAKETNDFISSQQNFCPLNWILRF